MLRPSPALICRAIAIIALSLLAACAAKDKPAGVSRSIALSVAPILPKSFDITASAQLSICGHYEVEELKEAWRKKALQVANGKKFKASPLVVHTSESDFASHAPMKVRSVTGTITLQD